MTLENELAIEILKSLRGLIASPPKTHEDIPSWYLQAKGLVEFLRRDDETANLVPGFLWHWLSDAEIRLKHDWYAEQHAETMAKFIEALEKGVILQDRDLM
jgi:hypothetical protein